MERITVFKPAWDKRNKNPKKNFGIHSVQCYMILKGKKGAVHFVFSTGMLLPKTMREYIKDGRAKYEMISPDSYFYLNKPYGFDVGYHSPKPMFEGQQISWPARMKKKNPKLKDPGLSGTQKERMAYINNIKFVKIGKKPPKCEWLGIPCYCDGSPMRGEQFLDILIEKGSDEIWKLLEKEYKSVFK